MTLLMNRLLAEPFSRSLTLAAFLGLILGSAIMVAMMIRVRTAGAAAGCLLLGLVELRRRLMRHVRCRQA